MQGYDSSLSTKVVRLNKLVEDRYGIDLLPYADQPSHVADVMDYYVEKREFLKQSLGENAIQHSGEYVRAYLISEAARMLLREIAPKRINKRKGQQ